jgi:hypothetical protein
LSAVSVVFVIATPNARPIWSAVGAAHPRASKVALPLPDAAEPEPVELDPVEVDAVDGAQFVERYVPHLTTAVASFVPSFLSAAAAPLTLPAAAASDATVVMVFIAD